jgi:serine/threonine protein kinase/HAMP domain-containing protein
VEIVGQKVGRYEIQEHIGEGGMAHVYRAFDPEINRAVALKLLKDEHCQDAERKSRFVKEGKAAGALTHPNIVTIYDVGQLNDAPYIMMELLEGKTLGDLLQEGTRFSVKNTLKIAMQLAKALGYAHSKGVVHRDMKPDNIILSSDGQSAKVADFGIARVEENSDKESTQVGMLLGTPRYMSPEQASGAKVDGRSDLFAVGVVLYEMITGKKAFDAESMPTLIMQIVQKNPLPIRQISKDTPVGLQKIVQKLLQKKADKRFQDGDELFEALERELIVLRESEEETSRYLPLQVKWTAIMAMLVAAAMALSSTLVFQAQNETLTQQAIDSGISLSKFVAVQAAIPVLGEDWVTLESFVQDASARESFRYLTVSDHEGVVRVATNETLVGKPLQPQSGAEIVYTQDDIKVVNQVGVFDFSVPILFNQTVVGSVNMGLDTTLLDSALDTTKRLMFILGLAIVLAVSFAQYIFNKLIAKNIHLVTRALRLFGKGQSETRISKSRSDEFGELFDAFNAMGDSVEKLVDSPLVKDGTATALEPSFLDTTGLDISGITVAAVEENTVVKAPDNEQT